MNDTSSIKAGDEVQYKKPGIKFATVLDGKVLSLDANGVATTALEDNSVAKIPVAQLSLKRASVVRALAPHGSFASKFGF
jgi:hypothetical protein